MNPSLLFNSKTDPIPKVRRDLQIIPIQENGDTYLYFHDKQGYATPDFALRQDAGSLLSLLDGRKSIDDLSSYLGENTSKEQLLQFIRFLDEHRLLASDHFEKYAKETEARYEQSVIHKSVTAGTSYPSNPEELTDLLREAFSNHKDTVTAPDSAKALYAPHIDPRVALDSYVKAFAPLKNLKPQRVVILATSHYAGLYPNLYDDSPFVLVNKDFETPIGTIPRNQSVIEKLLEADETGITTSDRAHRLEHSIELHLLFLKYLWSHEFDIVPFLVRGFDDLYYMDDSHLSKQLEKFSSQLHEHFANDEEAFFLISGDLSHFGKKFGDKTAASTMFEEVEHFDRQFLTHGSNNNPAEMLALIKKETDPYRICGFAPLYTFLQTMPKLTGNVLDYELWDEQERESAVTFGSILYSEE